MKLSREQRALLFAGECPKLSYPGSAPCPVKKGHTEVLSAHVWLEVTDIRRTSKGEWSLVYTLTNNRLGQRFMAKQDGLSHPEQYTSHSATGIDREAGEAVDEFTQRRITEDAKRNESQRKQQEAGDLLSAMQELRSTIDGLEEGQKRRISRTLWQLRSRLDSAEREMRKRLAA